MNQFTQSPNFPAAIITVNRHEVDGDRMTVIEGKLPDDLQGHGFILAAAGFSDSKALPGTPLVLPSIDGNPAINSDGMIFRLDFHKHGQESKPGEVWLKTKIVGTPSYWADKAIAEKQEYAQLKFYNFGLARLSAWLGVRNPSNTAWLSMKFPEENSRLFVTLDAGRSHEIDTESLKVVTPLGWNKEWIPQMNMTLPFSLLMSTAHPYFDARKNEIFTVNYCKSIDTILQPIIKQNLEENVNIRPIVKDLLRQLKKKFKKKLISKVKHSQNTKKFKQYLVNLLQLSKLGFQVIGDAKNLKDVTYLMRWDGKSNLERWKLVNPDGTPVIIQQTCTRLA